MFTIGHKDTCWRVEGMTIGEQLKKVRIRLGITQAQMCAGIISEPFYSRIEHGKSKIDLNDLIKILQKNHISLEEFWGAFEIRKGKYEQNYRQKLESRLLAAIKKDKVTELPLSLQKEMKYRILQIGEWNKQTLQQLWLTMPLWDDEELELLMVDVANWRKAATGISDATLTILSKVLVQFLQRNYSKKKIAQVEETIAWINELPARPVVVIAKLVARYYQALLASEAEEARQIRVVLRKVGYEGL